MTEITTATAQMTATELRQYVIERAGQVTQSREYIVSVMEGMPKDENGKIRMTLGMAIDWERGEKARLAAGPRATWAQRRELLDTAYMAYGSFLATAAAKGYC